MVIGFLQIQLTKNNIFVAQNKESTASFATNVASKIYGLVITIGSTFVRRLSNPFTTHLFNPSIKLIGLKPLILIPFEINTIKIEFMLLKRPSNEIPH